VKARDGLYRSDQETASLAGTAIARLKSNVVKQHRPNGYSLLELLFMLGLICTIMAIAAPMFANAIAGFRVSGDARSVSNAIAVAKMRAASDFSRVRLRANLTSRTYAMERWDKTTATWVPEGGTTGLSTSVTFGFGPVAAPPPNTQAAIAQAAQCTDDMGMPIANTACVMFNSRGVPVDSTFAPTGAGAVYVTNGVEVYGVTISATGLLRMWHTLPIAAPTWVRS
jgi:Tfp pilus assembly protein FimT